MIQAIQKNSRKQTAKVQKQIKQTLMYKTKNLKEVTM